MPVDGKFMEIIKGKYKAMQNGELAWNHEKDKIQDMLSQIELDIKDRYEIESPINIGGAGIVIKVKDKNLGIPQALKCPRPVAGKELLLTKIISSEISRLIESSHPNIVAIYFKGEVSKGNDVWPYYIMEYIEGAVDALIHIETHKPNYLWIINLIQQCAKGLISLHSRDILHGDIKLENLITSPEGKVKISDLGSARLLTGEEEETLLTFTRNYAHPELRGLYSETYVTDPNRVRAKIKRSKLKKIFDLYALGKNILRILGKYDIADQKNMPLYFRQYLELMASRMLDGYNSDEELALNLPKSAYNEIKYVSAEEVFLDIKKLTGEYSIHKAIPELDHHFPRTIQISSPASSSFTQRVANMLTLPVFRRLASLSQLGLIVQIYPTATHSRLEHVLGTFVNVVRYCDALWNDPVNPLFKQIMSEHDMNLLLLAALLHDIGQYPLAHDLEEAETKIFSHREISNKLLTQFNDVLGLKDIMKRDWGIEPEEVGVLLSTNPAELDKPLKYRLLHTLLDGPMDADKIDYLIRDSNNLNVPYGKSIDFERLLKCLTIIFKQQHTKTFISLGIHEKGKIPAEAVSFARYAMFGSVYWHHTSRSAKSMLHRAAWELLPSTDRKSKEYRELQKLVLDNILREANVEAMGSLFPEFRIGDLPEAPQLARTDFMMLAWIYEKTSDAGKNLLEMICERELFKRIIVISSRKNSDLWEKMSDLRKNYNWNEIKSFQNEVQSRLIQIIDSLEEDQRTSTILSKNITDEIVGRASKGEILFLVDIPSERKGSSYDLYFLSESRIHGPLKSSEDTVQMEDSILWKDLSENFLKSVGKIRVFCHPDIVETSTACLTRSDVESTLEAAYQYVTR